MKYVRIIAIEDEPLIRESLSQLFAAVDHQELILAAESVEDFHEQYQNTMEPDIVLLDIQMPGMTGIQAIPGIKKKCPGADIIMLTTYENSESIFSALELGAVAYLSKEESLVNISKAVDTVHIGGSYMSPQIARKVLRRFESPDNLVFEQLTPRQKQIAEAIVDGLSYKLIADRLFISVNTVRDHIKSIYTTLHVNSKTELINKVIKNKR